LNGVPAGQAVCNWDFAAFSASAGARYAALTWLDLVGQVTFTYGHGPLSVSKNGCGSSSEPALPVPGESADLGVVMGSVDPSLRFRPGSSEFFFGIGGRVGYASTFGTLTQPSGTTAALSSSGAVGGPQLGLGVTLLDNDSLEIGLRADLLWGPWGGNQFASGGAGVGWAF
jgi:hypothetical protein